MIILDTNVVSEGMRRLPAEQVTSWLDQQPVDSLFTTAITEAELWAGIEMLPRGARRRGITDEVRALFSDDFRQRVLPFDGDAARTYAAILAERRRMGRPMHMADAMIAGIARSRGATLATRNIRDFEGCGIEVVNPWSTAS